MRDHKILTYVDSDVLRAIWQGEDDVAQRAMEILDDPDRIFASSLFSKIELIPKPMFYSLHDEVAFYEDFFNKVSRWAEIDDDLVLKAVEEAGKIDLTPIDALHIVSAAAVGADEFVTAEKATKPLHRTTLLTTRTIRT